MPSQAVPNFDDICVCGQPRYKHEGRIPPGGCAGFQAPPAAPDLGAVIDPPVSPPYAPGTEQDRMERVRDEDIPPKAFWDRLGAALKVILRRRQN